MRSFLRFRGGMHLKNQLFKTQGEPENSKKLDMVLRQLTGDLLTAEQRRQIEHALGHQRQYHLRLCRSRCAFTRVLQAENGKKVLYMLTPSGTEQTEAPMTAVIRNPDCGRTGGIVYIYIPDEEERRDEPRNEETKTT